MSAEAQPPGQEGARLLSEKGEPAPADDEAYATAPRSVPYAEPKAKQNQRWGVLVSLLVIFFLSSVIDAVFNKKVAIRARNYPYVLAQLSPAMGFLIYGSVVAYLKVGTARLDPPATRTVTWWKPCVIGVLFSLHNVLRNLGNRGNVVPGYVTLLVAKLIVPTSAALSMLPPLRRRFDHYQWFGMLLLLAGVSVTIGPSLSSSYANDSFGEGAPFFVLLQCVAVLPLATAMLFVELQVQRVHPKLNVTYLWMLICVAEFLLGLFFAPFSARLQYPAMFADPSASALDIVAFIGQNLADGVGCVFLGVNSSKGDMCEGAWKVYAGALIFGCAFNLTMAAAVREGGATLMWFVRSMTLPFGSLIFTFTFVMGEYATELTPFECSGLAAVFIALMVYNTQAALDYRAFKK